MTNEANDRTPSAAAPEPPPYVPPAVAWEEEFEPLAQGSDLNPNCETGGICP